MVGDPVGVVGMGEGDDSMTTTGSGSESRSIANELSPTYIGITAFP